MFKVLITDDEPTIREGLRTIIDWEHYGFQVVDTAANGQDALLKYKLYQPDLIIVDIRMPGMSGLELIERIRQDDKELHVIILSGYADFDYAQKAINLRIDGYLLKPVDEDELIAYLEKLNALLISEVESRQQSSSKDERSREMVIQALLTAGDKPLDAQREQEWIEARLLQWNYYFVLLIKLDGIEREIEPGQLAFVKKRLFETFDEAGRGVVFSMEPYMGLLLSESLQSDKERKALYEAIEALLSQQGIAFTIASGGCVKRFADIGHSYEAAARLLVQRFFYDDNQILTPSTTSLIQLADNEQNEYSDAFDVGAIADKIHFAIDIGNIESAGQLVSEAGRQMLQTAVSEQMIKSHFAQIATIVLSKQSQNDPDIQAKSQQLSAQILHIYKIATYSAVEKHLIRFFQAFNAGHSKGGTDKQIKKMIDLIQRNYFENLRLESLADVFNYNSAYLGKLFKSSTGEFFNTYVDKVRIEKAKIFLDQGMKVYQVAEKVGYTNVDYFHSKFRKYVGVSPSSYRKKEEK